MLYLRGANKGSLRRGVYGAQNYSEIKPDSVHFLAAAMAYNMFDNSLFVYSCIHYIRALNEIQ